MSIHWHFFAEINCCVENDGIHTDILNSLETSYHKLLEKYFALVRTAIINNFTVGINEASEALIDQIEFLNDEIKKTMLAIENSEKK